MKIFLQKLKKEDTIKDQAGGALFKLMRWHVWSMKKKDYEFDQLQYPILLRRKCDSYYRLKEEQIYVFFQWKLNKCTYGDRFLQKEQQVCS